MEQPLTPSTETHLGRISEKFYQFHGEMAIAGGLKRVTDTFPDFRGLAFRRRKGYVEVSVVQVAAVSNRQSELSPA